MLGLFLDDERDPVDVSWVEYPLGIEWIIVRTVDEFIDMIHRASWQFDVVSFDHDLGEGGVGTDAVQSLITACSYGKNTPKLVFFHTKNPVGEKNMRSDWEYFINNFNYVRQLIIGE